MRAVREDNSTAKGEAKGQEALQAHVRVANTNDIRKRFADHEHTSLGARGLRRKHLFVECRVCVKCLLHREAVCAHTITCCAILSPGRTCTTEEVISIGIGHALWSSGISISNGKARRPSRPPARAASSVSIVQTRSLGSTV